MTITVMRVHMDCPGCENKVKIALQKLKGVDNIEIDMKLQKVIVNGFSDQKKILKRVRKTGLRAELWQLPHTESQSQYYQQHLKITEIMVHMDCSGCENKVKTALQKMKGVDDIEIDMKLQKVTVNGFADQKKVLKKVRKTGLRAELWQLPHTTESQSQYYQQHLLNGPVPHYASQPSSSYNYYKHGYDSSDPSHYHYPSQSYIFGHQTGATFSDDNPHACSIM